MPRKRNRMSLDERAALPITNDNPNLEYLRLSRRKICQTEIDAAVRLFLLDEDPISAHLLASAATEIMVALSNGRPGIGLNDMRALMKLSNVPSDLTDELFHSLLHPYNFLKHSSSDFSVENDFSIEYIMITIYSAVHSYKLLFSDLTVEMNVFYSIFQAARINLWVGTAGYEERLLIAKKLPLVDASYKEICKFGRDMILLAKELTFE